MVLDFNTLYDFPRNIEKFFDEFRSPLNISQRRLAYPPLNVSEDDNVVYVRAEIPGLDINDIELTLSEGSLILKGERKHEEGRYFRQERPTGPFQRIINLNVKVDRDKTTATMKNGLLEILLPKSEEVKPKQIDIKVE
ncbi:MAG TPA: Hsp20/alpha crystallin family protein [Desulfohalobiaceae bacterium]|nr:Hsp20/alpha crystallin family protein [Desulfohalobiaceae bacterium]